MIARRILPVVGAIAIALVPALGAALAPGCIRDASIRDGRDVSIRDDGIRDGGTSKIGSRDGGSPDGGARDAAIADAGWHHPSSARPTVVPPAAQLRDRIGAAATVRVEVHEVFGDGRHAVRASEVRDRAAIAALLDAVGLDQRPGGGCPRCTPLVRLFFLDRLGMNLGYVGADCTPDDPEAPAEARFESGSGEDCRAVRVRDLPALRTALAAHRPTDVPPPAPPPAPSPTTATGRRPRAP